MYIFKKLATKTQTAIYYIGWYQLLGGLGGALYILYSLIAVHKRTSLQFLVFGFMITFFIYSIFCGIRCIQLHRKALTFTMINQLHQLFGFAFSGYAFRYIAGIYVTVGVNLAHSIEFSLGYGFLKFDFSWNQHSPELWVSFNLIAFALVFWIETLAARFKEELKA